MLFFSYWDQTRWLDPGPGPERKDPPLPNLRPEDPDRKKENDEGGLLPLPAAATVKDVLIRRDIREVAARIIDITEVVIGVIIGITETIDITPSIEKILLRPTFSEFSD